MNDFIEMAEKDTSGLSFFFCDTTLRDGEQVGTVHYSPEQKVEIAKALDAVGIESIDAGFAATSEEERYSIKRICDLNLNMRIMSMCRIIKEDIDFARQCNVDGVILFIPGSDIHLRAKFSDDLLSVKKRLLKQAEDAIKYAKDFGLFVEFGVEDSTRTGKSFLFDVFHMAESSGADTLGTTDTIGVTTPEIMYAFIKELVANFSKPVGIHCHNDLGLATANTIAGLLAGGGYASPTVNGMGERAGNASLDEVIMILKVLYKLDLPYKTELLSDLSKMVQQFSSIQMDAFKPIVGMNAYSHESGIHIHGMLKDINTYEVFDPGLVGRKREYVFGKHAGKHLVRHHLEQKGYTVSDEDIAVFWSNMKMQEKMGTRFTEKNIEEEYRFFKRKSE